MKYALLILTTLLLWPHYAAQAQRGSDEYESKELEAYKKQRHKVFMPYHDLPSDNDTIEYQSPYCKIEETPNFSKYVWYEMHKTPYYDSITNLRSEQYSLGNKDFKPPRQTIGRVDKSV